MIQKRAHNIVCFYGCKCDIFVNLNDRRCNLAHKFFLKIVNDSSHPLHFKIANCILPSGRLRINFNHSTRECNSFFNANAILYNKNLKRYEL